MQLTPFCLVLSCLQVSPDRSQFFRYDTISLSCEGQLNSTSWKVKRKTLDGGIRPCSSGWGIVAPGSACIIRNTYPTDSGLYWCESAEGEQSNGVNITIIDQSVILESPALPVLEGAAVTLHCKAETNSSKHVFNFYKDGHHIYGSFTGEMTIHSASISDEGLYKCNISGIGESPASWLAVEASHSTFTPSPPASSCSVFRMMCHLVVGIPFLLSTILLGLICRDRKRASKKVPERRGSNAVIMEIAV